MGFSSMEGAGGVNHPNNSEGHSQEQKENIGFIVYQLTASWRIICGSAAGLAVLGEIGDWWGR